MCPPSPKSPVSPVPLLSCSTPRKAGKARARLGPDAAVRDAASWLYVELRGRRAARRGNCAHGCPRPPAGTRRWQHLRGVVPPSSNPMAQLRSTGRVAAAGGGGAVTHRHPPGSAGEHRVGGSTQGGWWCHPPSSPYLTWGSQEDLDQVLVEDERGRALWEQVQADGGVDCKGKRG